MILLTVILNGTDTNPYHPMGLSQNPFPQHPRAELHSRMMQLNSLAGDPLTGPDDLRDRLPGWSEEFIVMCCERFTPGETVSFTVAVPD